MLVYKHGDCSAFESRGMFTVYKSEKKGSFTTLDQAIRSIEVKPKLTLDWRWVAVAIICALIVGNLIAKALAQQAQGGILK